MELFNLNRFTDLEDPAFLLVVKETLKPYIDNVRNWWLHEEEHIFEEPGIYRFDYFEPGLFVRFTRSPRQSIIPGIQAFPFVISNYLKLKSVKGGMHKMITRVCMNKHLKIDEFTIVCKNNLPSLFNSSQCLCFIPTILFESNTKGSWLYLTNKELELLASSPYDNLKIKALRRLNNK